MFHESTRRGGGARAAHAARPAGSGLQARLLRHGLLALLAASAALADASAAAAVAISDARVRAAPEAHTPTLAFMTLRANEDMRLVGVTTTAAKTVAFQRMNRVGSELRMDPVEYIQLPRGQAVSLEMAPGHHHLLIKNVVAPLGAGKTVPMVAIVEHVGSGKREAIRFRARVEPSRYRSADDHANH